jgi:hypothetical protein
MKLHQEEYESQLVNVYSDEMLRHFDDMDKERHENAQHRKSLRNEREAAEKQAIGVPTKLPGSTILID